MGLELGQEGPAQDLGKKLGLIATVSSYLIHKQYSRKRFQQKTWLNLDF